MRTATATILLVLLPYTICKPACALADAGSAPTYAPAAAMKKYVRHQKKEQKKEQKKLRAAQKHAEGRWIKAHRTGQ